MRIKNIRAFTPLEINKSLDRVDGNAPKRICKKSRFLSLTGFTLIETLSSVAIFTVLAILILGIFAAGDHLWLVSDANASNQNEARRAIVEMERKIRGSTDFNWLSANSVSFTLDGEIVTYSLVPNYPYGQGNLKWKIPESYYIKETVGSETRRIANGIKSLNFSIKEVDDTHKHMNVIIDIVAEKKTLSGEKVSFTLKQIAMRRNS